MCTNAVRRQAVEAPDPRTGTALQRHAVAEVTLRRDLYTRLRAVHDQWLMTVVLRPPQNTCVTLHHGAAATGRFPLRMSMDKRVGAVGLQDIKKRSMAGASPLTSHASLDVRCQR